MSWARSSSGYFPWLPRCGCLFQRLARDADFPYWPSPHVEWGLLPSIPRRFFNLHQSTILMLLTGLCRRRGWRDPLYETYRSRTGFTCLVLVNGREYQTDLAYESDHLAQENAAMRAFMVCRNFSVNGGMLARNGVVQGLPASENRSRHRDKRRSGGSGGHRHSPNLSDSSSQGSSESP
jgi:hypothetical protein